MTPVGLSEDRLWPEMCCGGSSWRAGLAEGGTGPQLCREASADPGAQPGRVEGLSGNRPERGLCAVSASLSADKGAACL